MNAHRSLLVRNRATIRGQPTRLKESKGMERTKLTNGEKAEQVNTKSARRALQKNAELRPKAEKLVCRYCGSDDLAPSFIKRRDRRCRKCFSKRYGSRHHLRRSR